MYRWGNRHLAGVPTYSRANRISCQKLLATWPVMPDMDDSLQCQENCDRGLKILLQIQTQMGRFPFLSMSASNNVAWSNLLLTTTTLVRHLCVSCLIKNLWVHVFLYLAQVVVLIMNFLQCWASLAQGQNVHDSGLQWFAASDRYVETMPFLKSSGRVCDRSPHGWCLMVGDKTAGHNFEEAWPPTLALVAGHMGLSKN